VSLIVARFRHHVKVLVGNRLGWFLSKHYWRGKGPAARLISIFSEQAKTIGVEHKILVAPIPLKQLAPNYFLEGKTETDYRRRFLSGAEATDRAGIVSAQNVCISFPTGMHQVGNHILDEVMLVPYLLTNPKYYFGLQSMRFMPKRSMGEGVLLSMPWHHNFYHWMIEILPRLISYDRCPDLQHVPLIVPKSAPKFVAESLKLTGYLPKTVFLENGAYRFKKLHMLSRLAPATEVSPDAVDWLNRKIVPVPSDFSVPKRIYVSRDDAKIRFVSNEPELNPVLNEFGFETLLMGKFSLADQINIFRSADFILGPHGAAFTNLAFSKPGTRFIEFFSKGHYSPSYNRFCAIRGLSYGFLVGEPTKLGGFSIQPNHLREIITQALRSSAQ